ncbi:MAG: ABC transporter ATP-binding protein [Desulfopila sp.]|nr:ABC transporter ATP-binding protein [Desulfopila sp.]
MNKVATLNNDNIPSENLETEKIVASEQRKVAIQLNNISLCYQRKALFLFAKNKGMRKDRKFWALKDVSLTIFEGETIGVIGRNGSGKSTISRVFCGALQPDSGEIHINGRAQLLALGIGFRPTMTGRENVMISGSLLGLSRREIKQRMNDIEEFAELGDFFDEPIRTYSAGMRSRLGFAISTAVNPDILILDEVMSTGDASFRKKANERMDEMREKTKTVVVVSHNPGQLQELCSRVIWFEKGSLIMDGEVEEILPLYSQFCKNPVKWARENSHLFSGLASTTGPSRQQSPDA